MNRLSNWTTACAVLIAASFCGAAQASAAEKSENIASHMRGYAQEVDHMVGAANAIAAGYDNGEPVADQADALVKQWKSVDFHEALEEHADALYPPVWAAVTGLQDAVSVDGASAEVSVARQKLVAALYEGLGALKLVAADHSASADVPEASASSAAAERQPTIDVIKVDLQQALATYKNGDVQAAREQIHETYMQRFEGIEGDLIERDADLVTGLETDFNATLPNLIDDGAPVAEVSEQIGAMNDDLDTAQELLDEAAKQDSDVF